ncbi:serpin B6-like [Anoplophora glabripennis]|uniref:serpin B6-like n=1 Tax=Anoplophora glabripennis TaxID=217634 RepID=UPI0008757790|nr:serpin B6-like [Anoplophora glabripennis]
MKTVIWLPLALLFHLHKSQSQNIFQDIIPKKDMDEYGLALEAVFGLGLRLYALLDESSPSNFVVSPISATVIVSQLLLGAEGKFRDQLYDLLSLHGHPQHYSVHYYNRNGKNESTALPYAHIHFQLSSLIKKLQRRKTGEQFMLTQSNALFYNKDIELRSYFKKNLIQFYDSEVTPLDFNMDTSSVINNWASSHTNGLIKTILPSPPGPSTSSIFLNSIYFRAKWETPFSDTINVDEVFHVNENTNVITTYMQGLIQNILYAETSNYRVVCLPYQNNELGMYILFPNADSPYKYNSKQFIKQIDPAEVLSTISKAPLRDVVVKIPKLSLSNSLRLLEPLQRYAQFRKSAVKQTKDIVFPEDGNSIINRITDIVETFKNFTTETSTDIYLSGAAKNRNLVVSDIIQQIIFSINEEGTEAAAVTAGITDYMGGSKTVVLDRPFSFFIRHEPTLATIFWGTITDPSQN